MKSLASFILNQFLSYWIYLQIILLLLILGPFLKLAFIYLHSFLLICFTFLKPLNLFIYLVHLSYSIIAISFISLIHHHFFTLFKDLEFHFVNILFFVINQNHFSFVFHKFYQLMAVLMIVTKVYFKMSAKL